MKYLYRYCVGLKPRTLRSHRIVLVIFSGLTFLTLQSIPDVEHYKFNKTLLQYTASTAATVFGSSGAPMRRMTLCIQDCTHKTDCLKGIMYDVIAKKCLCTTTTPPDTEPAGDQTVVYMIPSQIPGIKTLLMSISQN